MISHRGYTIEQYPSENKIIITVPFNRPTALITDNLAKILVTVETMIEEDQNDDENR